jgi:glycerate dehydrogenase
MKLVVLDGYTLNPGDLSWSALRALGECAIHPRTSPGEVIERARAHEVVLINKVHLSGTHLANLPDLRYIGVMATGANTIDLAAARRRNIVVANVPGYGTGSVAQLTIALLLELTLQVGAQAAAVRSGKWCRALDFSYSEFELTELDGLTLGIVGYGRIGRRVAGIALAMGMKVMVHTRRPVQGLPEGMQLVGLNTLFREADVVSLHCPLTDVTAGLVDAARLVSMKPSALLINTSRGPLIDETALAVALNERRIAGAGLDVLSSEPPSADNPLLTAANCVITPHVGWATRAARQRLMDCVVANVRAFVEGQPQNVVSAG